MNDGREDIKHSLATEFRNLADILDSPDPNAAVERHKGSVGNLLHVAIKASIMTGIPMAFEAKRIGYKERLPKEAFDFWEQNVLPMLIAEYERTRLELQEEASSEESHPSSP